MNKAVLLLVVLAACMAAAHAYGETCSTGGLTGKCGKPSACKATIIKNLCPGPADNVCCLDCHDFCGTGTSYPNVTEWCKKGAREVGWNVDSCKCIVSKESGGNNKACNLNPDGSADVGIWQINRFNWDACNNGNAPCTVAQNYECAKKVFKWGSNTWKYWATCGLCGVCNST